MKRKLTLALCMALAMGAMTASAEEASTEYLYGYTTMSYGFLVWRA